MPELNQLEYYRRREGEQRAFAHRATDPDIVRFHIDLADQYSRLVVATQLLKAY